MRQLLDFAPTLLFLAGVLLHDIYTATVWLMVGLVALVLFYRVAERRWHRLHLVTAIVAIVLGGSTLLLGDPLYIKYKPTAVYGGIAAALLISHVWGSKVLLERIPQQFVVMPPEMWRRINLIWAGFYAACALVNVALALNLSDEHWALARTFGFPALSIAFMLAHLPFMSAYIRTEEEPREDVVRDHRP